MINLPLFLPGRSQNKVAKILAVDIGGTKTSFGLFTIVGANVNLVQEETYPSKNYLSFNVILDKYLQEHVSSIPDILSIGVAGPVVDGKVQLTNLSWSIDANVLQQEKGITKVFLLNDLEATAYGLAGIEKDDLAIIHSGEQKKGNVAILAPGTGLGEAGLFWDGSCYRPFATEGGHSEFSPRTELDIELFHYLRNETPLISWEYLISGDGIYRIYTFLRDIRGYKEPTWLEEKLRTEIPAAVVSHTAIRQLNETCVKAMQLFVTYMAREATNLVLKLKATGGLFLGGGIPPKIYPLLRDELFRQQFIQSDRMEPLLQDIPIHLILNSKAALVGAAYYGAFCD
ncbi:glucokinase [Albibacterium bauzanense]|nr:glucokinase [Albibacterium bauzanense]